MSKEMQKNVRKQLLRIGQIAKENFGAEKSEALTAALLQNEKKIEVIRSQSQVVAKKVHGCIQGSGSTVEKHQKKLPSNGLSTSLMEGGLTLGPDSLLGHVMILCGECQLELSGHEASHERGLEMDVVGAVNVLLEENGPRVDKSKKRLNSARLDMDSCKSRHSSAVKSGQATPSKLDALQSNQDEADLKFDHQQDSYATDMFKFLSKEHELSQDMYKLVERQLLWHRQAVQTLEDYLPKMQAVLASSPVRPVFSLPLEDHLRLCRCDIAVVIEQCVGALRTAYMDTEGLFRIAGSASKVKNLVAAFDARAAELHLYDPHTIAGALKQYLRDLPDPLLSYKLHQEWTTAASIADYDSRLQAIWTMTRKLPQANYDNLRYLMEFFHDFSLNVDVTKMGTSNLSLVIGPNLLWPQNSNSSSPGMIDTRVPPAIAEGLIEHYHWFFEQNSSPPHASCTSNATKIMNKPTPDSPQLRTREVVAPSNNSPIAKHCPSEMPPIRRQPPPPPIKPKPTM